MKMHIMLWLLLHFGLVTMLAGQVNANKQEFVILRDHVVDHERIFTDSEKRELNNIMRNCWKKGIADLFIVTVDERHTNKENFEEYVRKNLTSYALGDDQKNNGVVIALSKKLRKVHIVNGHGTEKLLPEDNAKEIIPKFDERKYFEGTLDGLNQVILFLTDAQRGAATSFTPYTWTLVQEFDRFNQRFADTDHKTILFFSNGRLLVNRKEVGTYCLDRQRRIVSFKIKAGEQPSFALFAVDNRYYYRYLFNRKAGKLYLVPLDEKEGDERICVEGLTLLFNLQQER